MHDSGHLFMLVYEVLFQRSHFTLQNRFKDFLFYVYDFSCW